LSFLTQNKANLHKMLIITSVCEKNANFFAENCQKSQKIVIITSTPGFNAFHRACGYFQNYIGLIHELTLDFNKRGNKYFDGWSTNKGFTSSHK
jgi:hypothetical protein